MISLILLKLFTFSQILQGVPKLSHATVILYMLYLIIYMCISNIILVYIYIYIYIYIHSIYMYGSNSLFLHSPGKMLLTLSLVQKWLGSPFAEDV